MTLRYGFVGALLLTLCGLSACVTMKVSHEEETRAAHRPYRKILVCSMNPDPVFAAQVESALEDTIHRSHLETDTCAHFLYPRRDAPVAGAVDDLRVHQFNAVLITQRVPLTHSSSTIENVIAGPQTIQPPDKTDQTLAKSFPDVESFVAAYDETRKREEISRTEAEIKASAETAGVFGKEISVDLRADLLGLEDHTQWSIAGDAQGGLDKSASDFIKSFAKTIETGLLTAGFIPKK